MKTVLIYSGGMDSTTLLRYLLARGDDVSCISINYGQRHIKELACAKANCALWCVPHIELDLSALKPLLKGSSQTDDVPVPEGHYAADNMKLTVVPNRNMVMLACAAAAAIGAKADALAYAAHAGDHTIYPDCRPEFVMAMQAAFALCDWHKIRLETPFLHMTKGQICRLGCELGVNWGLTWTCYVGGDAPCGKCGACQERREAFEFANARDVLTGGIHVHP